MSHRTLFKKTHFQATKKINVELSYKIDKSSKILIKGIKAPISPLIIEVIKLYCEVNTIIT
jgi:hypothetical protein